MGGLLVGDDAQIEFSAGKHFRAGKGPPNVARNLGITSLKAYEHYGMVGEMSAPFPVFGGPSQMLPIEATGMRERAEPDRTTNMESQSSVPSVAVGEEVRIDSGQAKNKAELPDQARSQLIANLVHDLRTPLVAIRGYTKMILENRAGPINELQREYLTIAAENTNRIIELLNQLAQITRAQPLHFEAFDARDLWRETLKWMRLRVPGKAAKITERISPVPLVVFGDKQKLTEVLTDFLLRAIQFTDPAGEIVVELSGSDEGDVALTISDTGAGIPAEIASKVVSEPVQPDHSMSSDRESLGAGLSLVQDLLRLHGGQISMSSNPGEGVRLLIALPML